MVQGGNPQREGTEDAKASVRLVTSGLRPFRGEAYAQVQLVGSFQATTVQEPPSKQKER